MSGPRRIQRRRIRGWTLAAEGGAVYVGRPTRWGNPYAVLAEEILVHPDGRDWYCPLEMGGAARAAVEMFTDDLRTNRLRISGDDVCRELRGRNLACWCPLDQPCHADVLLDIANNGAAS